MQPQEAVLKGALISSTPLPHTLGPQTHVEPYPHCGKKCSRVHSVTHVPLTACLSPLGSWASASV